MKKEDVLKVDIGVHVRGRILDSAFTLTFEPTYDKLVEAVKAATNTGIQVFTPGHTQGFSEDYLYYHRKLESMRDLERLRERYKKLWSHMKSRLEAKFTLVCDNFRKAADRGADIVLVKAIGNLSGHSIELYKIHGTKSVLLVKNNDQTKMEEGEYFAIETFGSTGRGRVVENVSELCVFF